ncbi:hypothetical protein CRENPOLYSF2_1210012 [Crenothrix polyspora]|uniref:Uncharacterized protein n=1 Tax=Crenothrix polyspora TaxID=360316 RepID=A0A1R4H050_9GAMM|nr:hypothetical protein CRENPOLYSF2_1210012 [Crenothrix polyspora]
MGRIRAACAVSRQDKTSVGIAGLADVTYVQREVSVHEKHERHKKNACGWYAGGINLFRDFRGQICKISKE